MAGHKKQPEPKPDHALTIWPRWRDPVLMQGIADRVRRGVSDHTAGALFGLSRTCVAKWRERYDTAVSADAPPAEDAEFVEAFTPIARASAEFFAESEELAAGGDMGRQWVLPRRLQSIYGNRQEVDVTGVSPSVEVAALLKALSGAE